MPAHQEWKRQVMAREIELEDLDTSQHKDRFGKTLAAVGPGVKVA